MVACSVNETRHGWLAGTAYNSTTGASPVKLANLWVLAVLYHDFGQLPLFKLGEPYGMMAKYVLSLDSSQLQACLLPCPKMTCAVMLASGWQRIRI